MPEVIERVNMLEEMVMKVAYAQMNTQIQIDSLSREMKDFKNEMKLTVKSLSKEIKELNHNSNKKYEELVKKLGTLAEDIVAPNIDFIAKKYFNCGQCLDFMVRRWKTKPDNSAERREFDVLALYEDIIILAEAKHNPKPEYAVEFIELINNNEFNKYFPEYENKKLIPIFASFYIPDNVVIKLSKNKIYAMATKEDTMDIINFKDIPFLF